MSRAIMDSVMLICCACLLALAAANAHSQDVCDVETLEGGYGFGANGFLLLGDDMVPTAAIGDFTFDGAGNVSGVATQNANGLVVLIPQKGTYTVDSDCTGSVVTTDSSLLEKMARTDQGRELLRVLATCALPAGDALKVSTDDGAAYVFSGSLGLAPEWRTGAFSDGSSPNNFSIDGLKSH